VELETVVNNKYYSGHCKGKEKPKISEKRYHQKDMWTAGFRYR